MKKPWIPLILIACVLTGCKDNALDLEYEQGIKALEAGQYVQAREHFDKLLGDEKRRSEAYRATGIAFYEENSYPEAIAAFSRSLNYMETSDEIFKKDVMFYLANARIKYGETDKAISIYDEILADGDDVQAYFLRGKTYLQCGDYANAQNDFLRALEGSDDYDFYINIYHLYEEIGETEEGNIYLEMAMHMDAETGEDYFQRGRIYAAQEKYDKAEKSLKTAIKMEFHDAMPMLGHIYLINEDVENARKIYTKYMSVSKNKAEAYNGLALCDIAQERYDSAMENIQKGLEKQKDNEKQALLYNEIIVLEHQKKFNEAKEKLNVYLEDYPDDGEALREKDFLSTR